MSKVIVVGAGPAGMMAAIQSAKCGNTVLLLEKNEKPAKKLFITGKGRCNLTNSCEMEELFQNMISNPKFLYGAFYRFSNIDTMKFFEDAGVPLKTERGNRVFPLSDKSSDIIAALVRLLKQCKVELRVSSNVTNLITEGDEWKGVRINQKETVYADALILACGGLSYPDTGSTGDGYRFAKELGHTIIPTKPALVPLVTKEEFVKDLMGLSLKNISVTLTVGKKEIYHAFGEMLFTHFGVSGPVILSASSYLTTYIGNAALTLSIDLKPALTIQQLDLRILREFEANQNKLYKNSLDQLLPRKLISVIIFLSKIDPEKPVHLITKEERSQLLTVLKQMELTITGVRDYKEAIITKGGVRVKEVNPSTMESKKMKRVYFAGELLDLDAPTGGFNLQIAWSTGYLAGISAK